MGVVVFKMLVQEKQRLQENLQSFWKRPVAAVSNSPEDHGSVVESPPESHPQTQVVLPEVEAVGNIRPKSLRFEQKQDRVCFFISISAKQVLQSNVWRIRGDLG